MLPANYLNSCPNELVELYSSLETDIVCDIARRLKKMGKVTDASEWQSLVLSELGGHNSFIQKRLKETDKKTASLLYRLLKESMAKATRYDLNSLSGYDFTDNQKQVLNNIIAKLADGKISRGSAHAELLENEFRILYQGTVRLTQTIAKNSEKLFVTEANKAFLKVATGAFDYKKAIADSVDSLARNKIDVVEYSYTNTTTTHSIESAVRSNVMTGINQLASETTEQNMDDLGCEFVEVSAHIGARETGRNNWSDHSAWQGKVFHRGGPIDIDGVHYEGFEETCGLGEIDGICGINCRHSYYPYFLGTPRMYEKKEIREMNSRTVEYKGNTISVAQAETKQREIERHIRDWKREAMVQEAGGNDSSFARQKMTFWQNQRKEFTEETKLRADYSREYKGSSTGNQPTRKNYTAIENGQEVIKYAPNINDLSTHVTSERMIERSVSLEDIQKCINNPSKIGINKVDSSGREGYKLINENVLIGVNPKTGKVTTVAPLSSKRFAQYMRKKDF